MEMILCDWTRMGRAYCLAGAVATKDGWTFVRPILHNKSGDPVRNVGWSPYLLDGHCRWELFELVGVHAPPRQPPHVEDVWVRALRPLKRSATAAQRRSILEAGRRPADEPLFGTPYQPLHSAVSCAPGGGDRSLSTLIVERRGLKFSSTTWEGRVAPTYRVSLELPGLGVRSLAIVDHFLLTAAELAGTDVDVRKRELERIVVQMGEHLVVRIGLTRPFASQGGTQAAVCWLMADGFFSLDDPQA